LESWKVVEILASELVLDCNGDVLDEANVVRLLE
jgi:hypothetical protein